MDREDYRIGVPRAGSYRRILCSDDENSAENADRKEL
ncbi:MAG: alpha amylase C-terminal domain-containing protein [Oscillospiraceae bacterium]